jgi:hypothetical protein
MSKKRNYNIINLKQLNQIYGNISNSHSGNEA